MLKKIRSYASQMRTDRQPEEQKTDEKDDLCEIREASFAMVNVTNWFSHALSQYLDMVEVTRILHISFQFSYCNWYHIAL